MQVQEQEVLGQEVLGVEEVFRPGTQVYLSYVRDGIVRWHRTLVEELTEEALVLLAPEERGVPERVPAGAEIQLLARHPKGSYAANAHALETRPGPPALLLVSRPRRVERASQRRYVRVDVDLPVQEGDIVGRVVNLSGSGCLLALADGPAPELGSTVRFRLRLPGLTQPLQLTGRVVRHVGGGNAPLRVGIEFVDLHERTQDAIMRFVLQQQAELIRLGLARRERVPH